MYGWGQNEELLGRALTGQRRDKVVIATKFGQTQNPGGANGVNGRPEYVRQACDASLKRLGLEMIDLYYQHRVDPDVPVEDTVGEMSRLVEQGKVRFLGLCEARPERLRRAHAVHPIAAVQSEFSLLYREEATETREATKDLGISFVAYAPLGRSLLAGVVPDFAEPGRRRHARPPSALRGRELPEEPRAGRAGRGDRRRQALHGGAAVAGLAAGAGPGRVADPRHQAHRAARGEPRRARRRADAGRDRRHRRGGADRRRRRHALSGGRHEGGVYLEGRTTGQAR